MPSWTMFTSKQKPLGSDQFNSSAESVAEATESGTSKTKRNPVLTTKEASASYRVVQPLRQVSILTFYGHS